MLATPLLLCRPFCIFETCQDRTQRAAVQRANVLGNQLSNSVADPDPGSGAFLTPGSGIRSGFFPDPGSWIPDPNFESLLKIFWGKSSIILRKLAQIIFYSISKIK
jgi:hypothetical protein